MASAMTGVDFYLEGDLKQHRPWLLERCGAPVSFPSGTVLSACGERPRFIYYILEGMVKTYTSNANGYVRLVGYHLENTLCVLDGLRGNAPSIVTLETVTPVTALALEPEQLRALCVENARFATDLLLFVGDVLRLMCFDAESQSIDDVRTRLANFFCLCMRSEEYRRRGCVPMTQENLASAVNASRVQTARILSDMAREGLIENRRGKIVLCDPEGIRAICE